MRIRYALTAGAFFSALLCFHGLAFGQNTPLPEISITQAKQVHKKKKDASPQRTNAANALPPSPAATTEFEAKTKQLNDASENLLPKFGNSTYDLGRNVIETLPQGTDQPLEKVLLQAPGVSQDSAASGELHVRNEHANLQYRINGILLPDGVSGFGQFLDTNFVGNMLLVTGALPAQYGLRTSGLVDIETRSGIIAPFADISVYGGSRQTITPSFDFGGSDGKSEYYVTGRYFGSNEGIENPTSSLNPIHDHTDQEKFFGYASTMLSDTTRFSIITGASIGQFQIPNTPGLTPPTAADNPSAPFTAFGVNTFDSSKLNDRQTERNFYNVIALQKSFDNVDMQLSYFTRYSNLHFMPDTIGDIIFNGVASDVYRSSFLNGIQGDWAYHLNDAHTLRMGFMASGEQTQANDTSTVLPLTAGFGTPSIDAPFNIVDNNSKLGWLAGAYLQDEWKISDKLTMNVGGRFDQMWQYVNVNQFSPRLNFVYKPYEGTTLHVGYARYFTPPSQVLAAEPTLSKYTNTTLEPEITSSSPVLPERSHYFDAGVTQKVTSNLEVGVDAYYKIAKDLLDDGQFGQALVLTAFNYQKGENVGVEFKAKYHDGNFRAYGNFAVAKQIATNIVSNQSLFGADELAYIASHYVYTDHTQILTGSAGLSFLWYGTRYSADMIYGSGLRSGDFNLDHVPAYVQVNLGVSHQFVSSDSGPITARFDIVNVFDEVYELRDGSGIGVFAPQYGPRRGFFFGLSKRL